jgi:CheY-like chemotaxis protein
LRLLNIRLSPGGCIIDDRFETNPAAIKAFHDRMLRRARQTGQSSTLRVEELTQRYSATADAHRPDKRTVRVLVVEDNPDQAESLAMVLALWGFKPTIAADGPTALETASRERPDVILADIGLPGGMDGFELAQQIHQQPELRDVPIAAVTAYTDEKSRQRSKEVGLVKHFGKPADLAALHRLLDDRRDELLRRLDACWEA